jgi:hypothetical protein
MLVGVLLSLRTSRVGEAAEIGLRSHRSSAGLDGQTQNKKYHTNGSSK